MKNRLATITCVTIAITIASTSLAKNEKKNEPKKKEVETFLKELGGEHFPERMKIYEVGSIEVEPTYYHVFSGYLKLGGYRIIVYDNTPKYLGYYSTEYEPKDYEEGAVLMDTGDGESFYKLEIGQKGPPQKARIGDYTSTFVKNPRLEEENKDNADSGGALTIPKVEKETADNGEVIDYREWKITMNGKLVTVNAIFVKLEGGKVTIKSAKTGTDAVVPGSALSDEDKEYVKRITAK